MCSHLCVLTHTTDNNGLGYRCMCEAGYQLHTDGKSCQSKLPCVHWTWISTPLCHSRVTLGSIYHSEHNCTFYITKWHSPKYRHVQCISMCNVFPCAMYFHVQCISMCTVFPCAMYFHVQCISMCNVFPCAMYFHV